MKLKPQVCLTQWIMITTLRLPLQLILYIYNSFKDFDYEAIMAQINTPTKSKGSSAKKPSAPTTPSVAVDLNFNDDEEIDVQVTEEDMKNPELLRAFKELGGEVDDSDLVLEEDEENDAEDEEFDDED